MTWVLRLAVLALSVALGLPVMAQEATQPSAEAAGVASAVTTNEGWMQDARQCPARLMPPRQAPNVFSREDCQPGGLSQCLVRCEASTAGGARACYWLAVALQAEGAEDAAEALFQQACKRGVASGCTNRAAGLSKDARGMEPENVCAVATFEATCAVEDPWGCTMLAMYLSRGMGVPQDKARALKVLLEGKSCRYGPEDEACGYARGLRKELEGEGTGPQKP